jgi:hypothetical protein
LLNRNSIQQLATDMTSAEQCHQTPAHASSTAGTHHVLVACVRVRHGWHRASSSRLSVMIASHDHDAVAKELEMQLDEQR